MQGSYIKLCLLIRYCSESLSLVAIAKMCAYVLWQTLTIFLVLPRSTTNNNPSVGLLPEIGNFAAVTRFQGLSELYIMTVHQNLRHSGLGKLSWAIHARPTPTTLIGTRLCCQQFRVTELGIKSSSPTILPPFLAVPEIPN